MNFIAYITHVENFKIKTIATEPEISKLKR
jgi:hypothetical protein